MTINFDREVSSVIIDYVTLVKNREGDKGIKLLDKDKMGTLKNLLVNGRHILEIQLVGTLINSTVDVGFNGKQLSKLEDIKTRINNLVAKRMLLKQDGDVSDKGEFEMSGLKQAIAEIESEIGPKLRPHTQPQSQSKREQPISPELTKLTEMPETASNNVVETTLSYDLSTQHALIELSEEGRLKDITDAGRKIAAAANSLDLTYMQSIKNLPEILKCFNNIELLILPTFIADKTTIRAISELKNLRELRFDYISVEGVVNLSEDLQTLVIQDSVDITDRNSPEILKCFHNIEVLILPTFMADETTPRAISELKNLRELRLAYISGKVLVNLASDSLRTLVIENSIDITDESLPNMANLRSLMTLKLSNCQHITDKGLAYLAGFTNLKFLYLPESMNLRKEGIDFAKKVNPSLQMDLEYSEVMEKMSKGGIEKALSYDLQTQKALVELLVAGREITGVAKNIAAETDRLDLSSAVNLEVILAHFFNVKELGMPQNAVAKDFATVSKLKKLLKLTVYDPTNMDLAKLTSPSLQILDIYDGCNMTNDGLSSIAKLGSLRDLNLSCCFAFTDAGITNLAPLKNLETLSLPSGITGIGIDNLAPLTSLRTLYLIGDSITNVDPRKLEALTRLTSLNITDNAAITDEDMLAIASFENLRTLHLVHCVNVTEEGVAKARSIHPALQIIWHKVEVSG